MVDGKAEAKCRQLVHVIAHSAGPHFEAVCADLENHCAGEIAILGHEFQEHREECRVFQRGGCDVAKYANAAITLCQATDDLHTAEQGEIINDAHQLGPAGCIQKLGRQQKRAIWTAQAREALIEGDPTLRQRHDGLKVQIHPAILQGVAHIAQDSILFRSHSSLCTGFGQLVLKAARQAINQALQLLHL